jgi:hypothetical protein
VSQRSPTEALDVADVPAEHIYTTQSLLAAREHTLTITGLITARENLLTQHPPTEFN